MTGIGRGFPFSRVPCGDTMEQVAVMIDAFPGLTRTPALMLVLLSDGRIKTTEFLQSQMEQVLGARQGDRSLNDASKRIRPHIGELQVQAVHGVGYRLIAPPGWKSPWENRNEA